MYTDISQLQHAIADTLHKDGSTVTIKDEATLRTSVIDSLVFTAVFAPNDALKTAAREIILQTAKTLGIFPASIFPFYQAVGLGKVQGFTVPALNVRALTYDTARAVFRLMNRHQIGPVVFEIARSEIDYTGQRPDEYTHAILAAAIKEQYTGPVFLQGDHFQLSAKRYAQEPIAEIGRIETLIDESMAAHFYNIDIDASTLVDLTQQTTAEQQKPNFTVTAALTAYIRERQPSSTKISIGGEIGHIGGKNSTVSEFEAFMEGYLSQIHTDGISKVSVQTGTSHGGIPLSDGTIAEVKLDFSVLSNIGSIARDRYHLGGAVQHGASTLPETLFERFVDAGTLEIHLATGFQNIVFQTMPEKLRDEMHAWTKENLEKEREAGWTDEQFVYKMRKKALGPFKKQLWNLQDNEKKPIIDALTKQFEMLFEKLLVYGTRDVIMEHIHKS